MTRSQKKDCFSARSVYELDGKAFGNFLSYSGIMQAKFPSPYPLLIQGTEMSEVKISVSIDDANLAQIEQISQQLQSLGMNVEKPLSIIGVITGSIESDQVNSLNQIEGVKNVEIQEITQLPPPSSGIQ